MKSISAPIIGITMGDPAGTGPELITRALLEPDLYELCRPVVIGDAAVLQSACKYTGCQATIEAIETIEDCGPHPSVIQVLDMQNADMTAFRLGEVSPHCGQLAFEYIRKAAHLCLNGSLQAMVTSAINKEALNRAGHHYDGHTGMLASFCGNPEVTMMLAAGNLRVSHVSTHLSLKEAVEKVRAGRIEKVIKLTHDAVVRLGIDSPRIAVAGLNPHAGENGLFGTEEIVHILPAIEAAKANGMNVSGPYPGDTVFFRAMNGEFDAAVAMYHDQGHVAVKMLGIWRGVNITLGLPIVRTSVEHGTNFDMAGTGRSDPRSLLEAIRLAARLSGDNVKNLS